MIHTIQWTGPTGRGLPFMVVDADRREIMVNARMSRHDALCECPDL